MRIAQPHELHLIAGDICRLDGKFKDAITWYENVLIAPKAWNEDHDRRYHARAKDSIDMIKRSELLDLHSDWKTIAVTFGVLCLVCVLGVCAWCVCLSCLLRRACESGVVR